LVEVSQYNDGWTNQCPPTPAKFTSLRIDLYTLRKHHYVIYDAFSSPHYALWNPYPTIHSRPSSTQYSLSFQDPIIIDFRTQYTELTLFGVGKGYSYGNYGNANSYGGYGNYGRTDNSQRSSVR
jgi:hypothetical protein